MNIDDLKFRASSIGFIMPTEKARVQFTEQCKTHLLDLYVSFKYGRREEIQSKYFEHGSEREQDALTLLSLSKKYFFKKNNIRLENEGLTGEPDAFIGEEILRAEEIFDTKCSWSLHTFMRAKHSEINPMYLWQGNSYMALTGAKKHHVAYCLVNATAKVIIDEKRFLSYKVNPESPEFIKKAKQIEINHIFDINHFINENPDFVFHNDISEWRWDIPKEERIFIQSFDRDDEKIARIYNRIKECKQWIKNNLIK